MATASLFHFVQNTGHLFDVTAQGSAVSAAMRMDALAKSLAEPRAIFSPRGLPAVQRSIYTGRNPLAGSTTPFPFQVAQQDNIIGVMEPLELEVQGMPSFRIYQKESSGNLVMSWQRQTRFMEYIEPGDLTGILAIGQAMYEMYKQLSRGPYKTKTLRALNNPFGYDLQPPEEGKPLVRLGRQIPRRVKGVGSIGHARGVRGSVPDRTVVNEQSGDFLRGWRWNFAQSANGIFLNFWNTAKTKDGLSIGWLLAHGTTKMQPHGPFAYVAAIFAEQFNAAWSAIVNRAFARRQAEHEFMQRIAAMSEFVV